MARLVIFGAGGCGRDALLAARSFPDIAIADDNRTSADVISPDDIDPTDMVVVAIGDGSVRRRVAARFRSFTNIIAPTSIVGPHVKLGRGAIIADFALLTTSVTIGDHFQCNAYSHVMHDCTVGDYVTLGSHVSINGNTAIGDGVTVGCGAKIRNGVPGRPLRIGEGAVIGMGAVVTKDVPAFTTVVGNPAGVLSRNLRAA